MITGTCNTGLIFGDQGIIVHTGTAEDVDGEEDNAADVDFAVTNELGCGHHTKMGSKCYGAEWE